MQDPDTARVDRIERRMDHFERTHGETLKEINGELKAISVTLATNSSHDKRIEAIETRILAMEKWQSWTMGIGVALIFLVTLFGPSIRRSLNLE